MAKKNRPVGESDTVKDPARKARKFSFSANLAAWVEYWKGLSEPQQAAIIGDTNSNTFASAAINALVKAGVKTTPDGSLTLQQLVNKYYAGNAPTILTPEQAGLTAWYAKVGV